MEKEDINTISLKLGEIISERKDYMNLLNEIKEKIMKIEKNSVEKEIFNILMRMMIGIKTVNITIIRIVEKLIRKIINYMKKKIEMLSDDDENMLSIEKEENSDNFEKKNNDRFIKEQIDTIKHKKEKKEIYQLLFDLKNVKTINIKVRNILFNDILSIYKIIEKNIFLKSLDFIEIIFETGIKIVHKEFDTTVNYHKLYNDLIFNNDKKNIKS